jgi:hypothetical protein
MSAAGETAGAASSRVALLSATYVVTPAAADAAAAGVIAAAGADASAIGASRAGGAAGEAATLAHTAAVASAAEQTRARIGSDANATAHAPANIAGRTRLTNSPALLMLRYPAFATEFF